MLIKIIRLFAMLLIILFSVTSVLIYQFNSTIQERPNLSEKVKSLLSYPSYLEDNFYDSRMKQHLDPNYKDDRLVLAAIDDNSIKKLGRFPWSRTVWVDLLKKLQTFNAKVVVFDVFFPEEERFLTPPGPDDLFVEEIKKFQEKGSKVIIPYSLTSTHSFDDDISYKEMPEQLFNFIMDTKQNGSAGLLLERINQQTYPIPKIANAAGGLAHVGSLEDTDGIFRRYDLVANIDSIYLPSYAMLAYSFFSGDKTLLNINSSGEAILQTKNGKLNLSNEGKVKIRWVGGVNSFTSIGVANIIEAKDDDAKMKKLLENKLIFIGSTAFSAHDLRHTPVDSKLPGVYYHMNVVNMLLDSHFLAPREKSLLYSWVILIAGTILMLLAGSFLHNAFLETLVMVVLCSSAYAADYYYFLPTGHEITLFFIFFSIFGTYLWNTLMNFYLSNQDKKFLKAAFGNYISPELIDEMYQKGQAPKLGGSVGLRTAYFTDIQGFSTFSEQLNATQLVELLNEYLTVMTDLLLANKGTLDKYEGDAIIAFFGAPLPLEDHATRACQVAIQMQEGLNGLRKKWSSEGERWPKFVQDMRMRIGINSGEIVTGNMGSKSRMNYTMMGDAVNLAARLEEAAKQYGIFSHVTETTLQLTNNRFVVRELDTIRVVGKQVPVTTFELLGEVGKTPDLLINLSQLFQKGIVAYKAQQWDEAEKIFSQTLEMEYTRFPELKHKTNPSKIYLERCLQFKNNPPPKDWDGVYTLTQK